MSKFILWIRFSLILGFALLGCLLAELPAQADEKTPLKHIFLISIGGLNQEGFTSTSTSNMNYLAGEGIIDRQAKAIRADTMESAETSLLTGTEPSAHKHYTTNDSVEVESIFDVLNKNAKKILVIDGSGGKLQSFAHGKPNYRKLNTSARSHEIFSEAYQAFQENQPFFTYIYIDDCSDALLRQDDQAYHAAIRKVDLEFGDFLKKLRESGKYKDTLVIVTSARSSSASDQVPVIMAGPGVKVNTVVSGSMIIDLAGTICRLAAMETPANSRGIPIYAAFNVTEEQRQPLSDAWIKALQKDRLENWDMNYVMDDELARTIRKMTAIKEEKQSIFDFAGEREQLIAGLKGKLLRERVIWGGMLLLFILGYIAEYFWLRKRFLLFK